MASLACVAAWSQDNNAAPSLKPDSAPGLDYRLYDGRWAALPDFETLAPSDRTKLLWLNYPSNPTAAANSTIVFELPHP